MIEIGNYKKGDEVLNAEGRSARIVRVKRAKRGKDKVWVRYFGERKQHVGYASAFYPMPGVSPTL